MYFWGTGETKLKRANKIHVFGGLSEQGAE